MSTKKSRRNRHGGSQSQGRHDGPRRVAVQLPQHKAETAGGPDSRMKQERRHNILRKLFNAIFVGRSGAWVAIFNCLIVVFNLMLVGAMRQGNLTSIATQRAIVSLLGIPPLKRVTGHAPNTLAGYLLHAPIVNSGATPTAYATSEISLAVQEGAPTDFTDFDSLPHSERHSYVIGPKQTFDGPPLFVSLRDLEAVDRGTKHIYVWGWVVYRDMFGSTPIRLTEFCTSITNPTLSKSSHSDQAGELKVDTVPCGVHSCYDEYCQDYSKRVTGFR